jgi:hypothetical protein
LTLHIGHRFAGGGDRSATVSSSELEESARVEDDRFNDFRGMSAVDRNTQCADRVIRKQTIT